MELMVRARTKQVTLRMAWNTHGISADLSGPRTAEFPGNDPRRVLVMESQTNHLAQMLQLIKGWVDLSKGDN